MKHIVGFSGGIDSQAAALWVRNRFPAEDVILINSNAGGNEHPLTDAFIAEYSRTVHPVVTIEAIHADLWKTPGFAETKGYESDAPLTFDKLIQIKRRPPSRTNQFCTLYLKLNPQKRWIEENLKDEDFARYTGVRRDESDKRKQTPYEAWDSFYDCPLFAPIFDWPKQMAFDYVAAHGEAINPLYSLGFNRVGCAPCINSGKADIRNWALRFPEMIDKLRAWEKASGITFFPPCVPGTHHNNIDEVVAWSMTERGGKTPIAAGELVRPACESKYGLCE